MKEYIQINSTGLDTTPPATSKRPQLRFFNKVMTLALALIFVWGWGELIAQVTVDYTEFHPADFNEIRTVNTNSNYFAGAFNSTFGGSKEIGMFANGTGTPFPGNPGVAVFRLFTDNGLSNGNPRPLQVGDVFTITGFVSSNSPFFTGGNAGISLNASGNFGSFSNFNTNRRARFQINQNGNWFPAAGSTGLGFATPGSDRVFTITITSTRTAILQISGGEWCYYT